MRPRPLLLLAAALAVAAVLAFRGAGRYLMVADPEPVRADAVVMLAGSGSARVLETARPYHEGRAPLVVLTREPLGLGAGDLHARGVRVPQDSELARQALIALGVPSSAIRTLGRRTFSTVSEARTIARFVCKRHLRDVVVVT